MAEHELKLKATIDTSQVQQQLNSLGRSAGNGININTQQIDQAFSKLAQSLNKLNATFEKAAMNMAKTSNTTRGSVFSGSSAKGISLGAVATFSSFAAQRGINKLSEYYESTGDTKTAKSLKTAGNITTNVIGGAAAGAAVGSVVPIIGTATGAAIGAGIGAVGSALEYLADKAREAADSLNRIMDWNKQFVNIFLDNKFRNEMELAKNGSPAEKDKLYSRSQYILKLAQGESDRLAEIAKKKAYDIISLLGKDVDWSKVDKSFKFIVDGYQRQQKIIQRSTAILETIDREREKEAKIKEQEVAKKQQLKNWQVSETGKGVSAMLELESDKEMATYESKSDTELEQIVNNAKKIDDELTEKLLAKLKERQEAINKGDQNIVNDLDAQIAELQKDVQMSDKKGELASKILDNRQSNRKSIADKQADFEYKYNSINDLETFERAISNNTGGIGNLKSLLHDLNHVKAQQNEAMRKANAAGDFDKRDRIASDYDQTTRKIDMLERQIENLNQTNIWEGAGQMSEMAKVGMYVSKSDTGLNDPKLQAQKEGNELLRQIKDNTANQVGGLE